MNLASGELVVDRHQSHLHESVLPHLPAALVQINSEGRRFLIEEIEFDRIVGESVCVQTTGADEIVWAKRPGRLGHSRFVKNRRAEPCKSIVVILKAGDYGEYFIVTAFIGHRPEPEPWDRNATANSRDFWNSHALVWGSEEIVPGTETTVCPW